MEAAPSSFFTYRMARGNKVTKLRVLSTLLLMNQRLHPGLLELAAQSGVEAVDLAQRQHFDYTSREQSPNWLLGSAPIR